MGVIWEVFRDHMGGYIGCVWELCRVHIGIYKVYEGFRVRHFTEWGFRLWLICVKGLVLYGSASPCFFRQVDCTYGQGKVLQAR